MIKYDIEDIYGETIFIANIDCEENTEESIKLRYAVLCAIENNISLEYANLKGVNLENMNLTEANFKHANLRHANFENANLMDINFDFANLKNTNFKDANLKHADFKYANLRHSNLQNAKLVGANFTCANLRNTILKGADLYKVVGNLKEIKSIQIENHYITYTSTNLQIGCVNHLIEEWKNVTNDDILYTNGTYALEWWKKWKHIIMEIIEKSPAEPTN